MVIDNLAPGKNNRIKGISQDWIYAETIERISGISFSKNSKHLTCMSIKINVRKKGIQN